MKKLVASFAFVLLAAPPASAGYVTQTLVTNLHVFANGVVLVHYRYGPHVDRPACATEPGFAFQADARGGEAFMKMVLAAHQSGQVVHMSGAGTCTVWGNREDLVMLAFQDSAPSSAATQPQE